MEEFRKCPVTGFKVHLPAEKLIKVNGVTAVVAILVGGIMALLVALTRWETIRLLPPMDYYKFLTLHGWNMLGFWIIFFEVAILYFAGAVMLNSRLASPRLGWLAYILMLAGAVITNLTVLMNPAKNAIMFTSYVPLQAEPLYYLGVILFAVGALIAVFIFFATLYIAKKERTYEGSLPLVVFGALTAAIIAVSTLLFGAVALVPTFLWSLGVTPTWDALVYRIIFWAFGHPSQQINVSAMIAVWYLLAFLTVGGTTINEKFSRVAFVLYILFINIASAHHLLVDPGVTPAWKIWNTSYAMYAAVLASMMHAFAVPGAIEVALRKKGYNRGLFEWLWKAPWSNPAFSALILSILTFGLVGGISGVIAGTEQINIRAHNTFTVPGHFHGTLAAGTTLAFMGLTYYVLPLIFRREIVGRKLAVYQPWLFGIGIVLVSLGMLGAGLYGVPRRHADVTGFGGAAFAFDYDPTAFLWLSVMGVGALLATVGGALYVLIAVGTLLKGKKIGG
jgi:cytochrome c oxidase subunit 1